MTLAAVVRLIHVWAIRSSLLFDQPVSDAYAYDTWAQRIAAGEWVGRGVFYQAPLYPYVLAVLYASAGRDLLIVRLFQALLGAAACVLLGVAGRRWFSLPVGAVAAIALAIWPSAVFADALIQKSVLDTLLMCALLASLATAMDAPRQRWWALVGLALGGLALTRENTLAFIPLFLMGFVVPVGATRALPGGGRAAVAFALGLILVLLPVLLRNYLVAGELHLTTAQFGPNLYIGNNPSANGMYAPLRAGRGDAAFEQIDATAMAERSVGHPLTPSEVSQYWALQAGAFIREQPGRWLELMARKAVLLINRVEVGDAEDQYTSAQWSPVLAALDPLLHFGVLVPLAAAGIMLSWPLRRGPVILLALTGVYALTVVGTFVMARYRHPLLPLLLLFAAAGMVESVRAVRARQWRRLVPAAVLALGIAIPANWPVITTATVQAVTHYNMGNVLAQQGRLDAAITQFTETLRLNPAYPDAHLNLGMALALQGDPEAAMQQYTQALQLDPTNAEAHANLGLAFAMQGEIDAAIRHYTRALQLDPDNAEAHANFGNALMEQGKRVEAIAQYRDALRIKPAHPETHNSLGVALVREGNLDEAIVHFQRAIDAQPHYAQAYNNLGNVLRMQDRRQEAIVAYTEALRLSPAYVEAHTNLAAVLTAEGRTDEAAGHYRAALQIAPDHAAARRNLEALSAVPEGK